MTCQLCGRRVLGREVGILMRPEGTVHPNGEFHALCIQVEGGELEQEARELWADLGHTDSWDAMIAGQRDLSPGGADDGAPSKG